MTEQSVEAACAVALFDARLDQLRSILDEFPADRVWIRPQPGMVSLGNLMCHVAGSMRYWFENGIAQGHWTRNRDHEFLREGDLNPEQLREHLDETRAHCDPILVGIDAQQWDSSRQFHDEAYTVREIVLHQVGHVSYHVGQAAFLRRLVAKLPAQS